MEQPSGIDGDWLTPGIRVLQKNRNNRGREKERVTYYEELAFTVKEASKF